MTLPLLRALTVAHREQQQQGFYRTRPDLSSRFGAHYRPMRNPTAAAVASAYNSFRPEDGSMYQQEEGNRVLPIDAFVEQQFIINNVAVAAVTLYAWEFISTLPAEFSLYSRMGWKSVQPWLFALVRYGTLPALILPAYSTWGDFDNTRACLIHQQEVTAVVQLIVAVIFVRRTVAIWDRDLRVMVFLIVLTALQFAMSFGLLWFTEETLLSNGACMPLPRPGSTDLQAYFYLVAFVFDTITIGLSFWKLCYYSDLPAPTMNSPRRRSSAMLHDDGIAKESPKVIGEGRSNLASAARRALSLTILGHIHRRWESLNVTPLLSILSRNGLMYFVVASAFNIANVGLELSKSIHSKALISLYAPIMCILCQRVILTEAPAFSSRRGSRHASAISFGCSGKHLNNGVIGIGVTRLPSGDSTGFKRDSTASVLQAPFLASLNDVNGSPASFAPNSLANGGHHPAAGSLAKVTRSPSLSRGIVMMHQQQRDTEAPMTPEMARFDSRRGKSTTLVQALLGERRHSWEGDDANNTGAGVVQHVSVNVEGAAAVPKAQDGEEHCPSVCSQAAISSPALFSRRTNSDFSSAALSSSQWSNTLAAATPSPRQAPAPAYLLSEPPCNPLAGSGSHVGADGLPVLDDEQKAAAMRMAGF
ncbi:hypothetical protein K437DRAFT_121242 [Tilletiaria anomala UBC 951]|uniref:DUF6533 domain-containing protein n=1 Tax=Tilletiaria anomala (strain ATCC 24038 / CBS 436.72 / UBC 951) TaxID=1037660 RepID=A0A066W3F2_TILAU|nr:uncharacterized protein K437DRAFT_121242 [Tilletiaria anomala UBC 951]KDN45619.1 hypothetical protein K437DRAFT_121242 [Tilletiaria anomala UBC 951]